MWGQRDIADYRKIIFSWKKQVFRNWFVLKCNVYMFINQSSTHPTHGYFLSWNENSHSHQKQIIRIQKVIVVIFVLWSGSHNQRLRFAIALMIISIKCAQEIVLNISHLIFCLQFEIPMITVLHRDVIWLAKYLTCIIFYSSNSYIIWHWFFSPCSWFHVFDCRNIQEHVLIFSNTW